MDFKTHTFEDEIFSTGLWQGFKATPSILREIVANFTSLTSILKVPLKLGHDGKAEVKDGQPALGWISSVRLDDETNPTKVFATYTDMPSIVFRAIKSKAYRTRSIELESMVKDGKLFKYVLTAVALLGSDLPRVNNLRDLDKYLMSKDAHGTDEDYAVYKVDLGRDTSITVSDQICFSINTIKKVDVMTPEEIAEMLKKNSALELANAKLTTTNVTLTGEKETFSKKIEDRDTADKATAVASKRNDIKEVFEIAVKAEVITPAQRESFSKLLGVDDDTKVINVSIDDVKTLIGGDATMFSKKDTGSVNADKDEYEGMHPSDILSQKTFEYMEKHGKEDFVQASFSVMRANPKLAEANLRSNEEVE